LIDVPLSSWYADLIDAEMGTIPEERGAGSCKYTDGADQREHKYCRVAQPSEDGHMVGRMRRFGRYGFWRLGWSRVRGSSIMPWKIAPRRLIAVVCRT
jgi:hypothetical protein